MPAYVCRGCNRPCRLESDLLDVHEEAPRRCPYTPHGDDVGCGWRLEET
jgi:hypothetical protein